METIKGAAFRMLMMSLGSASSQLNHGTVTLINRKSKGCELYLCGMMHISCFFIKLKPFGAEG
jgi:hypothetical protein